MTESEIPAGGERIRLLRELTPGFSAHHPDKIFDSQLDTFFSQGEFPTVSEESLAALDAVEREETTQRLERLKRLEHNNEGRRFCSELRDGIKTHFAVGQGQRILLEALKFMIRVHIDDGDRVDSQLPGVSHQLKVAKNVLDVLATHGPLDRYGATVLAAAMFHDIVEDHNRLLLLEHDLLEDLYQMRQSKEVVVKRDDGTEVMEVREVPVLSSSDSVTHKVITLLEYESGATRKDEKGNEVKTPNRFIGQIMRLVTLDRVELLKTWDGLKHEDAVHAAESLRAKRSQVPPEVYATNEAKKREMYGLYALDTFTDPRLAGEAASLIKIMDLRDNALTIGKIKRRYMALAQRKDPASLAKASELEGKYNDLKAKYRTVLTDLHKALPGWPKNTWVGAIAQGLHKEIEDVLREEYDYDYRA